MLTVKSLTSGLGLKLAAGAKTAGEHPIRWVHISELADPTPWLNGGELLLTTGIQLDTAKQQREFVRLLADAELAGLGLGTGFNHAKLPKALVAEAEDAGFPVFEVPYEMPFIAITEAAFSRLVNEQYDVLSRGIAVNERLERLVLGGGSLEEVVREIASAVGGSAVVLDGRGRPLASGGRRLGAQVMKAICERGDRARRGGIPVRAVAGRPPRPRPGPSGLPARRQGRGLARRPAPLR